MDLRREWRRNKKVFLAIMTIALPAITDLFAQTLLGFFDMLMVGRLGAEAISSVGVGNAPINAVLPIFFAVSIGTTALVSRAYGSNNKKEGKNAMAQSLILSLPISLGITLLLFIFKDKTLQLVGRANDMNLQMTSEYYATVLLGMPFLCFNVVFFAAYRSISKANMPMIANILSIFSNILFNYLFIFVFGWGVMGAGIATTLSRGMITCIFIYTTFFTKRFWVSIPLRKLKLFDKNMSGRILKVGIPAAVEQGVFRIGMLIFEMMVISLGTMAYTSHKIALTAESFSFNMGFGFSVAGTALVGQQLGKGSAKNAHRDAMATTALAIFMMSLFGLTFFIIPGTIIHMFTDEPEIKEMATVALRLVSICQPFQAVSMVLSGCLRGAGDTKAVLWITAIGMYIIRIPLTYFFLYKMDTGLSGAWIVMTIDLAFRSIACYRVFKKGRWSYVSV
nr:MATE family efflux transporter [Fusobacterium sp.]